MTIAQLTEDVSISSGSVSKIPHQELRLSKISVRWVPLMLTIADRSRVNRCRIMFTQFQDGQFNAISEIVSGDETWVYSFDPETKQQPAQ